MQGFIDYELLCHGQKQNSWHHNFECLQTDVYIFKKLLQAISVSMGAREIIRDKKRLTTFKEAIAIILIIWVLEIDILSMHS